MFYRLVCVVTASLTMMINYKTDGLNLLLINFLNEFAGVHKRVWSPTETLRLKVKYAVKYPRGLICNEKIFELSATSKNISVAHLIPFHACKTNTHTTFK